MTRFESEVNSDYAYLLGNVNLRVRNPVRSLLLMQTVIGHAQNGHGKFRHGRFRSKYPNATLDDIVLALLRDPEGIRRQRQEIIDSIFAFTSGVISGPGYPGYVDSKGKPLLSLTLGFGLDDPAAALTGIYLAGCMDSFKWRTKAKEKYNVNIGGGECVAVDLEAKDFRMKGLTLDDLAHREWSDDKIRGLEDAGVIITHDVKASTNKIVSAYVRHKKGKGTSDDLAIVLAGRLYGKDAAMGVFLCDAVDTWDKYAERIVPGGQDEYLGVLVRKKEDAIRKIYPNFEIPSEEDVVKFIYTISLEKADNHAISNSQRYLLQVDGPSGQSALESHLNYITGGHCNPMPLGHISSNVTNKGLYALFERRFAKNYRGR